MLTEDGGVTRVADLLAAAPPPARYVLGDVRRATQGNIYVDSPERVLFNSGVSLSVVLGTNLRTAWLVCKRRLHTPVAGRNDTLEIECPVCPRHLPATLAGSALVAVRYLRHLGVDTRRLVGYAVSRQDRDKAGIDIAGGARLSVSVDHVQTWPVVPGRTVAPTRDTGIAPTVSRWWEIEWNGPPGPALTLLNQWAERITSVAGRPPSRVSKSQFASRVTTRSVRQGR